MRESWLKPMLQEIRKVGGDLPIDAFLPELEASLEPDPPPVAEAVEAEALPPLGERPSRPRKARRTATREGGARAPAKPAAPKQPPADADMEAEIRAFMNRDQRGPSDDDDFSEFLGSGMDPNLDE